jgi:hypothetical protein
MTSIDFWNYSKIVCEVFQTKFKLIQKSFFLGHSNKAITQELHLALQCAVNSLGMGGSGSLKCLK